MPTRPYLNAYEGAVRVESYSVDVLPAGTATHHIQRTHSGRLPGLGQLRRAAADGHPPRR